MASQGARGDRFRIVRIAALLVATLLLAPSAWSTLAAIGRPGQATAVTNPADFRAFYCGAQTLANGSDPYRTEPLRACEQSEARAYGLRMFDGLVLPAPLPPYALALLAPIASFDFTLASPVWFGLSIVAFGIASACLARLARWPIAVVALVLLGPLAYVSFPLGQLMPVVVALLCAAALALREGRPGIAAALCALATLEPHVALPACIGAFVCVPRTRATFALTSLGAVALSLATAGWSTSLEYVRDVIPLHALSQVDQFGVQYSFTALVRVLGASAPQALSLGSLSYVAAVAIGVLVARSLTRAHGDAAFAVLVPAAFAVIGGTFVHLAQIAAAVPALVVLAARVPGGSLRRNVALGALIALAVPWGAIVESAWAAGAFAGHAVPARRVALSPAVANDIAEVAETAFIAGGGYGSNGLSNGVLAAIKTPTWAALLTFATLATIAARKRAPARFGSPRLLDV